MLINVALTNFLETFGAGKNILCTGCANIPLSHAFGARLVLWSLPSLRAQTYYAAINVESITPDGAVTGQSESCRQIRPSARVEKRPDRASGKALTKGTVAMT